MILGQKLTSEPVLWSRVYRALIPLWVKSPLVGLITRPPSFKLPELRVRKEGVIPSETRGSNKKKQCFLERKNKRLPHSSSIEH